jgi:hypothetical protein
MDTALLEVEREKDVFEVTMNFRDLVVNKNEIGLTLGYLDETIPEHIVEMIEYIIPQVSQRCEIRAGYRLIDVKTPIDRSDGLYVGGTFLRMQKIVTSQLRKAEKAALIVCTIGPAVGDWARQVFRDGDPVLGYLIDTTASVTVENVTDVLHDHVGQKMVERGMKITNRYSPGYCDWSVSEQHLLFSLLPTNFCGVSLTESSLMLPIKSVSGIIGVGAAVERVEYICDRCGLKDCTYRAFRSARTKRNLVRGKTNEG